MGKMGKKWNKGERAEIVAAVVESVQSDYFYEFEEDRGGPGYVNHISHIKSVMEVGSVNLVSRELRGMKFSDLTETQLEWLWKDVILELSKGKGVIPAGYEDLVLDRYKDFGKPSVLEGLFEIEKRWLDTPAENDMVTLDCFFHESLIEFVHISQVGELLRQYHIPCPLSYLDRVTSFCHISNVRPEEENCSVLSCGRGYEVVAEDQTSKGEVEVTGRGGAREGAGRPKIGKAKRVAITLPEEDWDFLETIMKAHGVKQAELGRELYTAYVQQKRDEGFAKVVTQPDGWKVRRPVKSLKPIRIPDCCLCSSKFTPGERVHYYPEHDTCVCDKCKGEIKEDVEPRVYLPGS